MYWKADTKMKSSVNLKSLGNNFTLSRAQTILNDYNLAFRSKVSQGF